MPDSGVLISPEALARRPDRWRVLDASWIYPPFNAAGIDVRRRYADAHLPGAAFLDLAELGPSPAADFPALTPPTPGVLRATLAALAMTPGTPLVVTDMDGGTTTAPFARLALLDAGFAEVRLLDGGTPAWLAAGLPMTAADPAFVRAGSRAPLAGRGYFIDAAAAALARTEGRAKIVDARFAPTNAGILPERFAEVDIVADVALRPSEVIDENAAGPRFKPAWAIRALAAERGLDDAGPTIAFCHFGLAAATVATALEMAGLPRPRVDTASVLAAAEPQAPSG
jgi:thiosulfate/3-mercaptopyruvate sulfurtransferase